jgi:putative membrane protein
MLIWISSIAYIVRLISLQTEHRSHLLQKEATVVYKKVSMFAFFGTVLLGGVLLSLNNSLLETGGWMYFKIFLVSLVIIVHHHCKIYLNEIVKDTLLKNKRYFNYMNLMLILFVALIILMTMTKPF